MAFDPSMMSGMTLTITKKVDVENSNTMKLVVGKLFKDVDQAYYDGIQDARKATVRKLKSLLEQYGVSGLASQIDERAVGYGFEIEMGKDDEGRMIALFVEYGTGFVGQNNPHPENPWSYDINSHGEIGWKYQAADGSWHRTSGMKSRPYFYQLEHWVTSYGIVARCVNKRLKKIK